MFLVEEDACTTDFRTCHFELKELGRYGFDFLGGDAQDLEVDDGSLESSFATLTNDSEPLLET